MYKFKSQSATIILFIIGVIFFIIGFNSLANTNTEQTIKEKEHIKSNLKEHIEFLADDSLKGRKTGTPEYELSAQYVARHFNQYGLKPGAEDGTWFQSVPLIESTLDNGSAQMILHSKSNQQILKYYEEFFTFPSAISLQDSISAPLIFVGYGISSKELNHDDYENIDVKGKIIVFINGRPNKFPSEEGAHVSDIREKIKHAAEHGAVGVIAINSPKSQAYYNLREKSVLPFLKWQNKDESVFDEFPSLKTVSMITEQAGEKLFLAANKKLSDVYSLIAKQQIPKAFDLTIEATLKRKSSQKRIFSSNIVGVLEGSDPKLKDEYLVISAHLDHIGAEGFKEGTRQEKDYINNGALDNASGIAVMLETARRLSEGERPRRSILFVALTAEEYGLLGSNYFAHNSPVPISSIVANVNLDMVAMLYPFADVIAFGAEHSTLKEAINFAAIKNEVVLTPDPMPEQAIFVRSDHYSFVKKGIPSIYLMVGLNSKNPKINGAQTFMNFYGKHYHQPTDDVSLQIDYDAGTVFTNIIIDTAKSIANTPLAPSWHKNSFFGREFKQKAQGMD